MRTFIAILGFSVLCVVPAAEAAPGHGKVVVKAMRKSLAFSKDLGPFSVQMKRQRFRLARSIVRAAKQADIMNVQQKTRQSADITFYKGGKLTHHVVTSPFTISLRGWKKQSLTVFQGVNGNGKAEFTHNPGIEFAPLVRRVE